MIALSGINVFAGHEVFFKREIAMSISASVSGNTATISMAGRFDFMCNASLRMHMILI